MPLKLQVVTVSVDYSDFLVHTLESNYKLFDKWVIVTSTKDKATQELCAQYSDKNVVCVVTDVFYDNGAAFNKYAGINKGLELVDPDAWALFLDSDIALHYETRRVLEHISLQEDCLYGIDRLNCSGYAKWEAYKNGKGMLQENWLLHTQGLDLGARLVHHYGHQGENGRFEGWRPLGFFQLAHRSAFESYPQGAKAADNDDLLFARQYPRNKRVMIPELFVVHLESEHAGKAVNWWGRKSQPFLPKVEAPVELPVQQESEKLFFDAPTEEISIGQIISNLFRSIVNLIKKMIQAIKNFFSPSNSPHYYGKD